MIRCTPCVCGIQYIGICRFGSGSGFEFNVLLRMGDTGTCFSSCYLSALLNISYGDIENFNNHRHVMREVSQIASWSFGL